MVEAITNVFSGMGDWIAEYMPTIMSIFYNTENNSVTFLGILALGGLGISIFFLLMGVVQNFLHFRG